MKKGLLLFILCCISLLGFAQGTVTTSPSPLNADLPGKITFIPSSSSPLYNYSGDIYVHIGVINGSTWLYVPADWNTNLDKCKMTKEAANTWSISLSPTIREWFGATGPITKIGLVFRNENGTLKGISTDTFVSVTDNNLYVSLSGSSASGVYEIGSTATFTATATSASNLSISVDGNNIASNSASTSLTATYTFNSIGSHVVKATATNDLSTVSVTSNVIVRNPIVTATRPTGTVEGINIIDNNTVTFVFYDQDTSGNHKDCAFLIGDFNNWTLSSDYQMKWDNVNKCWWQTVTGLDPNIEYGFQYYFCSTTESPIRCADPYCEKILDPWNDGYISTDVYPGLKPYPFDKTSDPVAVFKINKTNYSWQATNFIAPDAQHLRVYELLVRDFTTDGAIKAATAKLDYIKSLGMNAIELMPIQEFDGNDSWGYNPNFYFAPDKAYGTPNDYKTFIDECHKRGLAVILDVVFNHSWGQFPWCKLYWDSVNNRPAANNPFYNAIAPHPYSVGNDFKHSNPKVRAYFKNVLAYWMNEYKVDGFRFDLSKGFTDKSSTESTASNYDATRISYLKEYIDKIKSVNPKAYAILEHFCVVTEEAELANDGAMLWRNLNNAYCQSAMGYSSSSDFSGLYYGTSMPAASLMGYMESHDEERTAFKAKSYGEASLINSLDERMKQEANNAAFFFTVPGPKMIWQFEELGYDVSINENGRTGRKPVLWNYYDETARKGLYDNYSKICALRNSYPDLFSTSSTFSWLVATYNWYSGRFINIESADKQKHVVVAGNFSNTSGDISVTFPHVGTWYNYLDKTSITVTATTQNVQIPSHEFKLYTDFVPVISGIEDIILSDKEVNSVDVFSINGILVKNLKTRSELNDINLGKGCFILRTHYTDGTYSTTKIMK